MSRSLACVLFSVVVIALVATPEAMAQKKKVEITKKFSGSVADQTLMKTAPAAITSAKGLETVWKAWKLDGDVPKVDFTKDIIITSYTVGSRLNLSGANLDDNGNLSVVGIATRDLRPGFRYVFGVVSKEGIKSVNGKELPKD